MAGIFSKLDGTTENTSEQVNFGSTVYQQEMSDTKGNNTS